MSLLQRFVSPCSHKVKPDCHFGAHLPLIISSDVIKERIRPSGARFYFIHSLASNFNSSVPAGTNSRRPLKLLCFKIIQRGTEGHFLASWCYPASRERQDITWSFIRRSTCWIRLCKPSHFFCVTFSQVSPRQSFPGTVTVQSPEEVTRRETKRVRLPVGPPRPMCPQGSPWPSSFSCGVWAPGAIGHFPVITYMLPGQSGSFYDLGTPHGIS